MTISRRQQEARRENGKSDPPLWDNDIWLLLPRLSHASQRKQWERIYKWRVGGRTLTDIADRLGMSAAQVSRVLHKVIPVLEELQKTRGNITPSQRDARRENGKKGGRPVTHKRTSLPLPPHYRKKRGRQFDPSERNEQMHLLRMEGWTYSQIGRRFHVTRQAVQKQLSSYLMNAVCCNCCFKRDVRYMKQTGHVWACSPRCPE